MTRCTEEELRQYFPEQYEQNHNVTVIPTPFASKEKHKRLWFDKHRYDYVEVRAHSYEKAVRAWTQQGLSLDPTNGPYMEPHQILIEAALGGDVNNGTSCWLVNIDDYQQREPYGYVITHYDLDASAC